MRKIGLLVLTLCTLCALTLPATVAEARRAPQPEVSPELLPLVSATPPQESKPIPNAQNLRQWSQQASENAVKPMQQLRESMGVSMENATLGNVPVFILTPKDMPPAHDGRVLLHFHGGGYVLGAGVSGTQEATLMAGMGKFKVISVDYRLAPDHPYPAAVDDVVAVYRALLKTQPAKSIGVFGSSTGGALTLILALRAKAEGLPLPAALGAGSPWADMTKTGDSYFTNDSVDNQIVRYEGWISAAATAYAAGQDMKDPLLSPVYGDVRGLPPTLLTTGTRDLFLSNTARMHIKLRQAGVVADLMIFEAQSHVQYHLVPSAPETRFHFSELAHFFDKYLQ